MDHSLQQMTYMRPSGQIQVGIPINDVYNVKEPLFIAENAFYGFFLTFFGVPNKKYLKIDDGFILWSAIGLQKNSG
jgi:hypothetical protein